MGLPYHGRLALGASAAAATSYRNDDGVVSWARAAAQADDAAATAPARRSLPRSAVVSVRPAADADHMRSVNGGLGADQGEAQQALAGVRVVALGRRS